jgi:hypothetical protein
MSLTDLNIERFEILSECVGEECAKYAWILRLEQDVLDSSVR